MRKKWKQQLFVYLLIMSLIITLGMNVQPLYEAKEVPAPLAQTTLPGQLPLVSPIQLPEREEPEQAPLPLPVPEVSAANAEATAPEHEPNPAAEESKAAEAEHITVKEDPIHTYEVTAYFLNVRTSPSPSAKILKVVEKGERLSVTAQTDNGWLALAGEGFVHGKYAKQLDGEVQLLSYSESKPKEVSTLSASAVPQVKKSVPMEQVEHEPEPSEPSEPTSIVASDSGLTAEHIAQIFEGTELAGHDLEQAILEIEDEYGINAYFTIAVMKLESGNGKSKLAKKKNNLFGLNAIDGDKYNKAFSFETKADSVRRFGQLLSKHYVGKGLSTIEKVAKKYCPANSKWSSLVKNIMKSDYRKL